MKKIYSMKKVLLVVAALFACNTMFAQYTETFETSSGAPNKDIAIVGNSYTIAGTYSAGGGNGKAKTPDMPSNGFKMRTNVDGERCVFTVNAGYTITELVIVGTSNDDSNDTEQPCIKISKVEVDGVETSSWSGGEFPKLNNENSGTLTISDITAKESIAIYFDNGNVKKTKQINATYTVTYVEPVVERPSLLTVSPDTVRLVPGAAYKLTATVTPASMKESCVWFAGTLEAFMDNEGVSPENDVVELGENDTIIAKGAGEMPVVLTFMSDSEIGELSDTTIVIVSDFKAADHKIAKSHDFTAMGDLELTISGEELGKIWNNANSQCNGIYACTTEGLEDMAFQAVIEESGSNKKGWKNVADKGLYLTGAGRCAAITGLKAGQYVEFVYTGNFFTSKDCTMDLKLGPDAGAPKDIINEEVGRAIYQVKAKDDATEDLMVGFETKTGEFIKSITVYEEAADPTAIQELEIVSAKKSATIYNLMGMKVAAGAKGLLIKDGKKFVIK